MSLLARIIHERAISRHKERLDETRKLLLSRMPNEEQRRFSLLYSLPHQNARESEHLAPPPSEDAIEGFRTSQDPIWGSWESQEDAWPDVESAIDEWRDFDIEAANNFGLDTRSDTDSEGVNSAESDTMDGVDSEFKAYFDADPIDLGGSKDDWGNGPNESSESGERTNGEHGFDDGHSTPNDCSSHVDSVDFDLGQGPSTPTSSSSSPGSAEDVAAFSDGEAEDYYHPSTSNSTPSPPSPDKPTTSFSRELPSTTAENLLAFEREYNTVYHMRTCLWRRREAIESRASRGFIDAGSRKLYGRVKISVGSPLRNEVRPEDVKDHVWPGEPIWGGHLGQRWF